VAVAFIAADIVALEAQAPEVGDKLADRMHGIGSFGNDSTGENLSLKSASLNGACAGKRDE